jgi:predicted flap endonuclease-1-like 5' DNA nuclease
MLQALASGSTNNSERSPTELCCWALLLLLLLLFPLGKKRYDNSLIYQPNEINYVIGDNESKIQAVPSLHEYTKKYINLVNKDGLKNITYGVSGKLNGLVIDSKTGVISGHPKKAGKYIYEIVMKHSKGKFKGEVVINVIEKGKAVEEPEPEPEEEVDSKQAELDRIAAKAEAIDFGIIGTASASDKDDLKAIKGIGPFIEEKLNALGIYKVEQIAKMTSELEDEVNIAIEFFPGRVKRDQWVNQSKEIIEKISL